MNGLDGMPADICKLAQNYQKTLEIFSQALYNIGYKFETLCWYPIVVKGMLLFKFLEKKSFISRIPM